MDVMQAGSTSGELAAVIAAVDAYRVEPVRLSDADLLAELRERETVRRRLAAQDLAMVSELDRRALAARLGPVSTRGLLMSMLRLSGADARRRVKAAAALTDRVQVSGAVLPPLLPRAAVAVEAGLLSSDHAALIIKTIDDLPKAMTVDDADFAEAFSSGGIYTADTAAATSCGASAGYSGSRWCTTAIRRCPTSTFVALRNDVGRLC
jgi:hypothetical protein